MWLDMWQFFSIFVTGNPCQKEKPEMHFWKQLINVDSYLISLEIQIFKEQLSSGAALSI